MREEIVFIWVIGNFDVCFQPTKSDPKNGVIISPCIYAGNPRHSVWRLKLFSPLATADKRALLYHFDLQDGSFYGDNTCEVQVMDPNGRTQKVETYCIWCTESNTNYTPIQKQFLPEGTLTLKCKLTFTNVHSQYCTDITELSQKTSNLYGDSMFSDLTLYTNDQEFILHKFIIRKRAPKLFTHLGLQCEKIEKERVKVENISTLVLQTMLKYLYSGKLDSIPEKYLPELYETLKKYQLKEFNEEIIDLGPSSIIGTQIKVDRRNIYWNIEVIKTSSNDSEISDSETSSCESQSNNSENSSDKSIRETVSKNYPLYKYIQIGYARFLIEVRLITGGEIYLRMKMQCVSLLEDYILLNCSTSLGPNKNSLDHYPDEILIFSNGNDKHDLQTLKYDKCLTKGSLVLGLNLVVSKGEHTCSVNSTNLTSPDRKSVYGMGLLSYELNKLIMKFGIEEDVSEMEDVIIGFENCKIRAHKAILHAGSSEFSNMFLEMAEKKNDHVNISDIDYRIGKILLAFMYSGRMIGSEEDHSAEDCMKLYIAAKKYKLPSLLRKCSRLLANRISEYNACEILLLASDNSDECLLSEVQHYIEFHREVLGSDEWNSLIEKKPLLVSRILQYVTRSSLPKESRK